MKYNEKSIELICKYCCQGERAANDGKLENTFERAHNDNRALELLIHSSASERWKRLGAQKQNMYEYNTLIGKTKKQNEPKTKNKKKQNRTYRPVDERLCILAAGLASHSITNIECV